MNRVFISEQVLNLIIEQGLDLEDFLSGTFSEDSVVRYSDGRDCGYAIFSERQGFRGLFFPEIADFGIEQVGEVHRPCLNKRLSMACQIASRGHFSFDPSWGPHSHDGLTSFYIAPIGRSSNLRSVCSLLPSNDVCVWRLVPQGTIDSQIELDRSASNSLAELKSKLFGAMKSDLESRAEPSEDDTDVTDLHLRTPKPYEFTESRSFDQWLPLLTKEQKAFVDKKIQYVQRLRGPAGTGKTLTMCLKAIKEVRERVSAGEDPSVIFLTHSWALSFLVDDQLMQLDDVHSQWITVWPLLELARDGIQKNFQGESFRPVGEDSEEAKSFMQDRMALIIEEFTKNDWITYKDNCSPAFRGRVETESEGVQFQWDVLNEIGSVINGMGLFTTKNDESKYVNLERTTWMMELTEEADRRVLFALYRRLNGMLEAEGLISYDQELNDYIRILGSNTWNLARLTKGYDLVFVDEFHKLNLQEREILPYLTKERDGYPPLLMSTDLVQGSNGGRVVRPGVLDSETDQYEDLGRIENATLKEVHRYTPQILALANHLVRSFGGVYDNLYDDPASLENSKDDGPKPVLVRSGSLDAEITWVQDKVNVSRSTSRAVLVVDSRQFDKWSSLSNRRLLVMRSTSDALILHRSSSKTVVARPSDVVGLQFDEVFVVGLADDFDGANSQPTYRRDFMTSLYQAITRAKSSVFLAVNDDFGWPRVLHTALEEEIVEKIEGRRV